MCVKVGVWKVKKKVSKKGARQAVFRRKKDAGEGYLGV